MYWVYMSTVAYIIYK